MQRVGCALSNSLVIEHAMIMLDDPLFRLGFQKKSWRQSPHIPERSMA